MYKRILALALLAALLLSGCQSGADSGDTYNPAADWPKFTMTSDGVYIGESDLGYYLPTSHFLQFIDKQTMQPVLLCAKPNCLHNEEPDQDKWELCDAYFRAAFWDLPTFFIGGQIYVFSQTEQSTVRENNTNGWEQTLVRMNPDGTERTELFALPAEVSPYMICIHRDVFYYVIEAYEESGELSTAVYARPLDQKSGESKRLFEVPGGGTNSLTCISAYGNYLYIQEYINDTGTKLHIYNLKTDEHTTMPIPEGLGGINLAFILQDKLYVQYYEREMKSGKFDVTSKAVFYQANLDGTDQKLVSDTLPTGWSSTDGTYIYHITRRSSETGRSILDKLHILNGDFEEVCVYDFADFETDGSPLQSATIVPLQDGRVFMQTYQGSEWVYHTFTREEVESGGIEPQKLFGYVPSDYFQ